MCRKLRLSRQSFYQGRQRRKRQAVDEELVMQLVDGQRRDHPQLGTRKLLYQIKPALAQAGVKVGRDRLFEILRAREKLVERRRPEYPCTTNSYHVLPIFRNLVREATVTGPNQVYVNDITFIRTAESFLYLSLCTDQKSRKIVGYHCSDSLDVTGSLKALEMALEALPSGAKPIHHSDRGCQYCSHEYVSRLKERGLPISMTETNHCAENALAERMNGILKDEYGLGLKFPTKALGRLAVAQAVDRYNNSRPHGMLANKTPAYVHSLTA